MSSCSNPLSSPLSASITSHRPTTATKNLLIDNSIRRISIDSSNVLGNLYDARSECVVGKLTLDKKIIIKTSQQNYVECVVMKADKFDREDIFRKIGIHEEPWLNLVLKIVPAEGIASIINYSFSKSSNIRFLYYYYSSEEQSISQIKNTVTAYIPKVYPDIAATHVISAIKLGIQAVIVLQLPSNDEMNLDSLLEDIAQRVRRNKFQISSNEKPLLDRIIVTKVFSNIPTLNNTSTLAEISQKLNELKSHVFRHLGLEFTLRMIKWFYPTYPNQKARYTALESDTVKLIKQYLVCFSSQINELKAWLSSQEAQTLKKHLKKQYNEFEQKITDAEKRYSNELQRIRDLIIEIRSGIIQQQSIIERLSMDLKESLQSNIDLIQEGLESLRKKIKLINKLDEHEIPYWNMQQYSIAQSDDLTTIFQKLCIKDKSMLIFCSNDYLRDQNLSAWNEQYTKWMQGTERNFLLTLIYADFTYTSYQLSKVNILSLRSKDGIEKQSESLTFPTAKAMSLLKQVSKHSKKVFPSSEYSKLPYEKTTLITEDQAKHEKKKSNSLNLPPEEHLISLHFPSINYINVLLLGELGVGKSTFINALVNYLAFKTFEQARSSQPLVAMPVSFLMTIGDDFQEKIVRFGDIDPNEDHDHPGQSVTQHCRSYVFRIGTETKLRIIDTPGMGDTRGLEQDDRNMEHILSFINNLSHLNAICILLKPNESRLNVVLRSYFTRFLNFLGENARNNIVFCFTNTRTTFFAPGNTGPLLREMINSLSMKGILFEKRNTFCFDSEAFRYLVALQNGIQFDTYQEKKYQNSWTASSTVSNHLIQFICKELKPYSQNEWQSIEHAQFKINQLICPMLETVRNILRNIILLTENSSKLIIKLRPVALSEPSSLCYKCPRTPHLFSDFWIVPHNLHTVLLNTCNDCDCDTIKHIYVDYKLEYELIQHEGTQSFEKMKSNLEHIRMAILECSQFYSYVVDTSKQNDPLLSALKRIIAEEKKIYVEKGEKCLNATLYDAFTALTEEYKERRTSLISIHRSIDLASAYELIEHIGIIDEINEQMGAIKRTQKKYLKEHEKQVL